MVNLKGWSCNIWIIWCLWSISEQCRSLYEWETEHYKYDKIILYWNAIIHKIVLCTFICISVPFCLMLVQPPWILSIGFCFYNIYIFFFTCVLLCFNKNFNLNYQLNYTGVSTNYQQRQNTTTYCINGVILP